MYKVCIGGVANRRGVEQKRLYLGALDFLIQHDGLLETAGGNRNDFTPQHWRTQQSHNQQPPLRAKAGDRVRLYLLNAGPSGTSSFHIIGAILDRVWYEGSVENEWRGMQTVLLGASNSAVMEFIVPEAGSYTLVDHEFADVERGAAGLLIAAPRDK